MEEIKKNFITFDDIVDVKDITLNVFKRKLSTLKQNQDIATVDDVLELMNLVESIDTCATIIGQAQMMIKKKIEEEKNKEPEPGLN